MKENEAIERLQDMIDLYTHADSAGFRAPGLIEQDEKNIEALKIGIAALEERDVLRAGIDQLRRDG